MTLKELIEPFPWALYSKKLQERIRKPRNIGFFTREDAELRGMRHVEGSIGSSQEGNWIWIHWLVDPDDGIIVDAKCQVFGQSALIGAADASCDLVVGKNYDQARRISAEVLDHHLRDRGTKAAFPQETYPHINLVLDAIDEAASTCTDIPFAASYVAPSTPIPLDELEEGGYAGWDALGKEEKVALIEQVLDQDIRPYIAMDAGGVEVIDLEGNELTIAYQGACTSCIASVGTTLSYIQQILKGKISPELIVTPKI